MCDCMKCPICENDIVEDSEFIVKELQMGLREEFKYVECSHCGCLFLKDMPQDMSKYYDKNYAPHQNKDNLKNNFINKMVGLYLSDYFLISKIVPKSKVPPIANLINNLTSNNLLDKNSSILDVGCGRGDFLNYFKKGGFKDLTGIDLFIDDENIMEGINLIQTSLEDFNSQRKFDLIISNHAFEHMDNQLVNLKCFEKLVKDSGLILLRVPVKGKFIWDRYGVNWYQIDAPRHLFLHTLKSFECLCNKTNLIIENVIFDSSYLMFTDSEKYMRDISMRDKEWNEFQFDDNEMQYFKEQASILNKANDADQAIFILKLK